jgi:hypothetical protein
LLDDTEATEAPSNILSKLLYGPRIQVSAITSECLELLRYHKRHQFKIKEDSDLSGKLSAVKVFVEQWSAAQLAVSNASLSCSSASNIYRLNHVLNSRVPSISVSDPAVGSFLSKWSVKNITQSDVEDEEALQMGIQASMTEDTALESELAIIDNAVTYRLSRWMSSFPENLDHVQWPTSFTTEEKKKMRNFVRDFLNKNTEMWAEERSKEELASDVAEMRSDENFTEFPVTKGKAASIIQQVLKDLRSTKHRNESRSKSRSKSRDQGNESDGIVLQGTDERGQKRRRDADVAGDDHSDGAESVKQRKRPQTESMRGRTRRRSSPLKRQLRRRATEDEMLEDEILKDAPDDFQFMVLDDSGDEDYVFEEE